MSTIHEIARLIAERFDPERVILFGSHARGRAGEHSDVDLLVEMPAGTVLPGTGNPIRRAIAERYVLPMDVIVRTADQLRSHQPRPNSVLELALRESVVLYDKRAA
jgi:predicted nucleotidyltransferase